SIDTTENTLLVYRNIPALQGQYVGPGSRYAGLSRLAQTSAEEGVWETTQGVNPVTKQEEPRRVFAILHDGLVFSSSHSALVSDVEASVREYVAKATAKYDQDGLDAVIAHYNSEDSLEGQFYLFLIGADDLYLAHPIFPHLIGTDIKDVVGSDGQELGKEIALATEDGIWVEYLWPHPVTRREQQKVTWAIRHDGLIFASGYYAGAPEAGSPAWRDADPRQYTVQYVNRAVERYEQEGLESFLNYYNSVASFEGQWYLFATDADDIYHVHPLIPELIGTDIKAVVGSDGYELGKELAKAVDGGDGVWVEYLWPHPVTLKEVPKVGYAVRHDGMLFASGYYPQVEDPAGRTQEYVNQAIEYYKANGRDATVTYYKSPESLDGQWNLTLADENDTVLVAVLAPQLIGTDLKGVGAGRLRQIGREMAAATEEGRWVSFIFPNTRSSETLYAHTWAIRYDGLLFTSRYFDDQPEPQLVEQPLPAPAALTAVSGPAAGSAALNWTAVAEATRYRVHWISRADVRANLADDAWLDLLGTADLGDTDQHTVTGLNPGAEYFFIVGVWQADDSIAWSEWDRLTLDSVEDYSRAATRAYVQNAIDYYEENGLDATVEFYRSAESVENGRTLVLMDKDDSILLTYRHIPALQGQYVGPGSAFPGIQQVIDLATEEGAWATTRGVNPDTGAEEPRSLLAVLHGGLVFSAAHSALVADVGDSVKEYVRKATAMYDREGLDAVIAHYNSQDSLEGQFYLFLIGADDIYLAHPIFPHLIGTDIKDVVGSDGQELGKEIALATEDGIWVEYLWPHPVTRRELQKVTWAIRHDGLIFASGYYAGAPESGSPAWQDADPSEYTVQYVHEAIERYERDGLQSFLSYYNSVASFEGEWYLFATDADDIYHVHPLIPRLIGTDIKDVVGSDGFELGKELAKAVDGGEGVWVEYLWPHPVTLKEAPKVGYAVRRDGMLFASGYYVRKADPVGYTREYVAQAIEHYKDNGLEATIEWYNSRDSLDGQWGLTLADENDIILVAHLATHLVGSDLKNVATPRRPIGEELVAATEEGIWVSYVLPNIRSSERLYAHTWAIRYDGLLFMSRYHDDQPDVPGAAE
ncbi:MAG: hypothetical protein F4Y94_02320, partial [Chloroflexi bacterium]|nr:hypothetical protein [Chloroflexota bacterium]